MDGWAKMEKGREGGRRESKGERVRTGYDEQ